MEDLLRMVIDALTSRVTDASADNVEREDIEHSASTSRMDSPTIVHVAFEVMVTLAGTIRKLSADTSIVAVLRSVMDAA